MSNYWATADRVVNIGNLNLGAGAETLAHPVGKPIDIKRIVLVMTAAQATAGAVVTIGVRNVDDSSSVTAGTFTTPAVMAINGVFKVEIAKPDLDGIVAVADQSPLVTTGPDNVLFTNAPGVLEVNPGQEFFITSGGEGDTGAADVYLEYSEQGNNPDRFTATEIVFTPA